MKIGYLTAVVLAIATVLVAVTPGHAQSVEEFYKDKVVTLYIGFSVGGGYDVYGRLVARHIGRHIPGNPVVVPINMTGAGSLRLANWLYNAAPDDGSVFGTVNRGVPFEPLLGNQAAAQFDARKYTWIGSTTDEVGVCVAAERTGITKFSELYDQELIVGGTGPGADDDVFPKVVQRILGANLRLVTGYAGGNNVVFALERGEVDGRCGWSWSSIVATRGHWLEDGSIKILLQLALRKHPDLPDVPLAIDLAKNDEDRSILRLILVRGVLGRPFMAPPGVPADRAAALQHAFDRMVKDSEFLAEAERSRLEIAPISGPDLQALITDIYASPPQVVAKARAYLR